MDNCFVMCDLSIGMKFCSFKQQRYVTNLLFLCITKYDISVCTVALLLLSMCLNSLNARIFSNSTVTPTGIFSQISSGPSDLCLVLLVVVAFIMNWWAVALSAAWKFPFPPCLWNIILANQSGGNLWPTHKYYHHVSLQLKEDLSQQLMHDQMQLVDCSSSYDFRMDDAFI